jgi:hypothetical protein
MSRAATLRSEPVQYAASTKSVVERSEGSGQLFRNLYPELERFGQLRRWMVWIGGSRVASANLPTASGGRPRH